MLPAAAAAASGRITGVVADPTGAVIPQAVVTAMRAGHAPVRTTSDDTGRFSFSSLAPGSYVLEATEAGFTTGHLENVHVTPGAALNLTLTLAIASDQQSVTVTADSPDTSPEKNGGAITLKGDNLEALSDDPDELSTQLQAIAGADAESGSQVYIDGFSGGRLPPKNSIREIRINQNPYSAQYDQLGFGRIEIFTKPGADRIHASYWMQGNDSALNAPNPFVQSQPPYYMYQLDGDFNGPITKDSSYFLSMWARHNVTNSIVKAQILDDSLNEVDFSQAVPTPSSNLSFTARYDTQLGKVHTLTGRYQYSRGSTTNSGVGQFSLASQGSNSDWSEHNFNFTDIEAWSPKILNEVRFQYMHQNSSSTPVSTGTTVSVQGAFTGGGSGGNGSRDTQEHYELNDLLHITRGPHDIDLGGRLRVVNDSNYSTGNYNGSYTFSSLAAYQITKQALQACQDSPSSPDCLTPTQIRAAGGGASLFSQTSGTPTIAVSMADAGLFAEDNWKIEPNVTLSYGLRFETQSGMHDHADYAPRIGVAWSIPAGKDEKGQPKPAHAIIRSGFGLFYSRFGEGDIMQAERQNGVTQSAVVIADPDFFPGNCTSDPDDCAEGADSATSPTIYTLGPSLRAPYVLISSVGADKPIGKHVSLSVNYFYSRGLHQLLTRNVNAPEPGTYDPSDPTSGVRPMGTNENVYQYSSDGNSRRNRVNINGSYNTKHGGAWGYVMLSKAEANSSGGFPSNQYDLNDDWGRGSWDVRSRGAFGGYTRLPGGFSVNPFITYEASAPFNITVAEDLNGDSQFNDRPAYATDMSRASVYHTKWGNFDADPIAGQKIIPINLGKGPGQFNFNLALNKRFRFGPVLPDENAAPVAAAAKPAVAVKAAAPAAATAADGKKKAEPEKPEIDRKYTLGFGLRAENLTNHPNYSSPVGLLGSSLFGTSTSVIAPSGNFTNRAVSFETFFRF